MSNEKKIEDLIHSISSLIKEAEQESKLLLEIENKIESFDLKKENMLNNKKLVFQMIKGLKILNQLRNQNIMIGDY